MTSASSSLVETLQQRFELGSRIASLNARKMSRQQAGFGAEVTLLQQRRDIEQFGDSPARQAVLAEAMQHLDDARNVVAALDAELVDLEAQIEALDRRIAAAPR